MVAVRRSREAKEKLFSRDNYAMKKRLPFDRLDNGKANVYVTNKTNFMVYLKKCEKLFDNGASEVIIHGLGAAIQTASSVALRLQELHHGALQLDTKTSTVNLVDDLEPLNDEGNYRVNNRQNSAIHIRAFRKLPIVKLDFSEQRKKH